MIYEIDLKNIQQIISIEYHHQFLDMPSQAIKEFNNIVSQPTTDNKIIFSCSADKLDNLTLLLTFKDLRGISHPPKISL